MNTTFETYLNQVDHCLKPLPLSERVDIIKEIKGSILEMENDHLTQEQIIERLGHPKDLAKAYLSNLMIQKTGFQWQHILTLCAFYGLTGLFGAFIIPILGIVAPTFILCSILVPIAGCIKYMASLWGYDVPYIMFQFGTYTLSPLHSFLCSILIAIIFFLLGKGAWKLLIKYLRTISHTKQHLSI